MGEYVAAYSGTNKVLKLIFWRTNLGFEAGSLRLICKENIFLANVDWGFTRVERFYYSFFI